MAWWPFSGGKKRRRKRKKKANKAPRGPKSQARRRAEAMRDARASGRTTQTAPKKRYVPPPVPDDLSTLPPGYIAPEGPEVWAWVKRAPLDYFVEAWFEDDPQGFEDFSKWPRGDTPKVAHSIRRHVLDLILEASKAQYPQEFGATLRAEKGIITEIMLLPGTVSGDTHAIFQFHMAPVDMSIVGTIHSHPSPVPYPSAADTNLFERWGRLHIITGYPFGRDDWRAFDHRSRMVRLEVVD